MREVSIYIDTSISGRWNRDGYIGYCLEYYPAGRMQPVTRYGYEKVENMNANRAQQEALIRAISRIREKCVLSIYTESEYLFSGFTGECRVEKWKNTGWRTSRGEEVKNRDKWQELDQKMKGNVLQFFLKESNAYRQLIKDDLQQLEQNEIAIEALVKKRNGG